MRNADSVPSFKQGKRRLRVLVYPHSMEVGGSQTNALEIAAGVRDLGHDVVVYSEDGPMVETAKRLGLPCLRAREKTITPSLGRAAELHRIINTHELDILHGYEWPPCLEAYTSAMPTWRTRTVCTVMSMSVASFIPKTIPLVVGTQRILDRVAPLRSGPTYLIEPPIDLAWNRPSGMGQKFRRELGLNGQVPIIVIVCRLAAELKLEGILTAIRAVKELAKRREIRLIIVGDGPARDKIMEASQECGPQCVILTGEMLDPRAAYDAADIVIGMGGSALRALSFSKPLIVQGEQGFFELLTPSNVEPFLRDGWYGRASGDLRQATKDLGLLIDSLLSADHQRVELGRYGRRLVESRFSLERASRIQEEIYCSAMSARNPPLGPWTDGFSSLKELGVYKVRRRMARNREGGERDDFNARPI